MLLLLNLFYCGEELSGFLNDSSECLVEAKGDFHNKHNTYRYDVKPANQGLNDGAASQRETMCELKAKQDGCLVYRLKNILKPRLKWPEVKRI